MILTNISYQKNIFEDFLIKTYGNENIHMLDQLSIYLHEVTSRIKYEIKHDILSEESLFMNKHIKYDFLNVVQSFLKDEFNKKGWFNNPEDRISVQSCYLDHDYLHIRYYYEGPAEEELIKPDIIIEKNDKFYQYQTLSYHDSFQTALPDLFKPNERYGDASKIFVHTVTFQTSEDCNLNCTYCLRGTSKILMMDGSLKEIKNIKIGDRVLSFDENCNNVNNLDIETTVVTKVMSRHVDKIYRLSSNTLNNDLYITGEHPVYTKEGIFKEIKNINSKEDILLCYNNGRRELIELNNYTLEEIDTDEDVYNFETIDHTYIANGLLVHNCYQLCKTAARMSFDTAKKAIDDMLHDKYDHVNRWNSPAIIIEFIGGEPLLEMTLTRRIYEYFLDEAYKMNHPWFDHHRLSICSNGLLYFDDAVQSFFEDYKERISFNISIDGNKSLHDSARIQQNHEGSYNIDMLAYSHYIEKYKDFNPGSKMTLSPSNIKYLYESLVDFINQGFKVIHLNCVFEEGWTIEHAKTYYHELQKVTDYILDNNLEKINVAIFGRYDGNTRLSHLNDNNFCFKKGTQILTVNNGNMNIEDIQNGDLLYTASGTVHKVVKTHKHKSDDNVRINATGVFPIDCTSNHKFFAKKFLYKGFNYNLHYSDPDFYPASELKKGDKIGLTLFDFSKNDQKIDDNIAILIGIYLGDGCLQDRGILITTGYDTDKVFFNILKNSGLYFTMFTNKTTMMYFVPKNSSELNKKFYDLCKACGRYSHGKHFPSYIWNCDESAVNKILDGYYMTDGYEKKAKDGSSIMVCNTVSPHLANDLTFILRSLGYFPTVYLYKRNGKMKIQGRDVNVKDRYEITYHPNRQQNGSFKYDEKYPILWTTIRDVNKLDESFDVYNVTVEGPATEVDSTGEHTIIANGVANSQCGGLGAMLALDPHGNYYPCIRYMPTSLASDQEGLVIGNINDGINTKPEHQIILDGMSKTTRRSQSNDICFDCPINQGCAWCSGLNYMTYGTWNKRSTFHCKMHIVEILANVYYWNLFNIKHPEYCKGYYKNNVPDEWALEIIDKEELDFLKSLELRSMQVDIENGILNK